MNGANSIEYKHKLEDLLNLRRSAWHSYLRAARTERFSWRRAPKPFHHQLKAFLNDMTWVFIYLEHRFGRRHRFQDYGHDPSRGIYPLVPRLPVNGDLHGEDEIRVSLAGDWGTGTEESNRVANHIREFNPHYTIHLGDIYFVGGSDEVEENCLGNPQGKNIHAVTWPKGSHGSFALNGNHEMYANGHAYFDHLLPRLGMRLGPGMEAIGQRASYFALKNRYWVIVSLDTGYNSVGLPILERIPYLKKVPYVGGNCSLPPAIIRWLREDVRPHLEGRSVIILTHHQYYSAFEDSFPEAGRQLREFISRPVLWFWGHEHRLAIYGLCQAKGGIPAYGRCLGHGGMPVTIRAKPRCKPEQSPLVVYDDREYRNISGTPVGYNGYVNLIFTGPLLRIEYRDIRERDNLLMTETWEARGEELVGRDIRIQTSEKDFRQYHPDLHCAIKTTPQFELERVSV